MLRGGISSSLLQSQRQPAQRLGQPSGRLSILVTGAAQQKFDRTLK
jgi:hypothetical protein